MDKQTINVAGLSVNVFSLKNTHGDDGAAGKADAKPVAILFMLHGRTSRADHMELVAKAFLDGVHARRKDEQDAHDLWVVTFVGVFSSSVQVTRGNC